MDRSKRVTIAGNLWANTVARHPRLKGGSSSVVANNVGYNFERALNLGGGVDDETTATIIRNYYRAGPRTPTDDTVIGTTYTDAQGPITAYIAYNETEPNSMPVSGAGSGITMADKRPCGPTDWKPFRDGRPTKPCSRVSGLVPPTERTTTNGYSSTFAKERDRLSTASRPSAAIPSQRQRPIRWMCPTTAWTSGSHSGLEPSRTPMRVRPDRDTPSLPRR
ncbi:hypothetical protein [Natronorubrum halophilum]|uniref:hypothetical protein n=1 Tax=Natronorubrum halophilum TaxID=1702106 RepID=UPI000EF6837E|nr:hypothetical protein [Natronorubrum halophilum]